MRPIKKLQEATYFKRIEKSQIVEKIDLYKSNYLFYYDDEQLEGESASETKDGGLASSVASSSSEAHSAYEDLTSSYWMPLSFSRLSKSEIADLVNQPEVKKLNLP